MSLMKAIRNLLDGLSSRKQPSVSRVTQLLTHRNSTIRWQAAKQMVEIASAMHRAAHTLVAMTNDDDNFVRFYALTALGEIGSVSPEISRTISQARRDKDPAVRQAAKEALEKIRPRSEEKPKPLSAQ